MLLAVNIEATAKEIVKLTAVSGGRAPSVELSTVEGRPVKLADYQGVVTLVHFWATWCAPCIRELPDIVALRQQFNVQQLRVIVVAIDSHAAVKEFINKHPNILGSLKVMVDQYGGALRKFRIKAIPSSYVIDKTGSVTCMATGRVDWAGTQIRQKVMRACSE